MDGRHQIDRSAWERPRRPEPGPDGLAQLEHLEYLIGRARAWSRQGLIGQRTHLLLVGLVRADIADLKREIRPAGPAREVPAAPTSAALRFARWLYRHDVLRS